MTLPMDKARTTYPTAFAEITSRIEEWRNELFDCPDVALVEASVLVEGSHKVLEITAQTDLYLDGTDEPLRIRFRACCGSRMLH